MGLKIVAELAQGFEGKLDQAILLMRAASKAGADAVKFQMVFADELATPDYQHYHLFKSLEMPDKEWKSLADLAKTLKIELHLDIFGSQSLELAQNIGVEAIKLHGTDIANIGLLKQVSDCNIKTVYLGAGGANLDELKLCLDVLSRKQVVILFGFQGYPTQTEDNQISRVNLLVTKLGSKHSNLSIGFADHADPESAMNYAIGAIAIGAGATVIEKHLTLGRALMLEDHEAALNPDEFLTFSTIMRNCYAAFGPTSLNNDFNMSNAEAIYRKNIRRHVVAKRNLEAGVLIKEDDVVLKRTSFNSVITNIGDAYKKVLKRPVAKDGPINSDNLE
jgi:N,N'-diacetyllegionaminate synthase